MSNESNRWMDEQIDGVFNDRKTITKEELKRALEELRTGRGGRARGGTARSGSMPDEMKQKLSQLLDSELDKINSNTITKEQAKSILSSFGSQAKEQSSAQKGQCMLSSIKDELNKLNVRELTADQARDLLRKVCHKMQPEHGGSGPTMLDDEMKNEFLREFQSKHGTNKINGDEAWEMIKSFDKKHHEKMGCCEKNSDWDKEKEQKWDEIFNEQYRELVGDLQKTKINQQQLEDLAKRMKDKLRPDCSQYPGKRFCQH